MRCVRKVDLVKRVAKEAGITNKAASLTVSLIFEALRETVLDQKSFVIPGVGTVTGYLRPAKMGRDPRNGEMILFKEKLVVRIKSYLKE